MRTIYIPDANEAVIDAEIAAIIFVAENRDPSRTSIRVLAETEEPSEVQDVYSFITSA